MESDFELPINVRYRSSRRLALLLVAMHAGAALAVSQAALPAWTSLCIVLVLACSGGLYIGQFSASWNRGPVELTLTAADQWLVKSADGTRQELQPMPPAFVHPWLLILRFKGSGNARQTFLFTPDNCDADLLRRLRVRLAFPVGRSGISGPVSSS
ncbi:MAG: hypothetical protein HYY48_12495 [Gammaproteobacteria bacterium]|nr:hypothetical protein [Gammaproteobacteria bacterium]